jgi:hypothetical protein
MDTCVVKSVFEFFGAAFALGAAGSWFGASWIARGSMLNTAIQAYDRILMLQARYNAIAALCAGVAAVLQLIVLWMPVCRAFASLF